jgi:putative ABC transport system permease protein
LIGLDRGLAGRPWVMRAGSADAVHRPETVLVDELYLDTLGVAKIGDEVEMMHSRAVVGGISGEVRTLTASPFVFTSLKSAIRYDKRYRPDEITYVLARCAPGQTPEQVRDAIAREVPDVEVLTTGQFARRTMKYWMLETGLGISVVITALLGLAVGAVIISQTLFAITQDHRSNYATLLALGFGRGQLGRVVLVQSLVLGGGGIGLGGAGYFLAARLSMRTPVPLETTPVIFAGIAALALLSCVLASFVSIRSIFRVDPVSVFRV